MFRKVLIANRNEIAVRVIRACHELDIITVAVYCDEDKDALHVRLADEAVSLGDPRNYANKELITRIAKQKGAEAIHPGYGFLSENAEFAQLCAQRGLVFIGPAADAIAKMGDKAVARETMIKAGVPVIPGSENIITDEKEVIAVAENIGYPVVVKASAGGGGRGMRVAYAREEIIDALRSARSEAKSAFGSDEVYIEKYLDDCKHIEFQILADNHGQVIHLGERDCSVQRRNQKLIEEAPSLVLTPELRQSMGEIAVAAAKAVNYSGAATVEFLLSKEKELYFMEMNTRIQVEHPITEMITRVDLIREQLYIASGAPLRYKQEDITLNGHAVECRINAENPYKDFQPNPGKITFCHIPQGFGVRVDTAMYPGSTVLPHYDSLIGKVITWGSNRKEALQRMRRCLNEFIVEGVETTIPFHLHVMDNKDFQKDEVYTNFLTKRLKPLIKK